MGGITRRVEGGTDWSLYTPFNKATLETPAASDVYETYFQVTGRGYITTTLLNQQGVSGVGYIRVTIDGSLFVLCTSNSASGNLTVGCELIGSAHSDGSSQYPSVLPFGGWDYASRAGAEADYGDEEVYLLGMPVFFNESLLVEFKHTTGQDCNMYVCGGVI